MIRRCTSLSLRSVSTLSAILFFAATAAYAETSVAVDPQKQLNDITTSLLNGSVATIDILHMPDRVETRASVNPEQIEKWFDYRITINRIPEWAGRTELLEAMKSSTVMGESRMPDLRSAIIFYDSDRHRIGALYFGRYFGRYLGQLGRAQGAIGNTPVSFKGDLPDWLKHMIPSSLH